MLEDQDFIKHQNCMDVFFWIWSVTQDTGNAAIIHGNWCTQGTAGWWTCSGVERLFINNKQYSSWKSYVPAGISK